MKKTIPVPIDINENSENTALRAQALGSLQQFGNHDHQTRNFLLCVLEDKSNYVDNL